MTYCVSDIHGEYEKFLELLKKIHFSSEDTLYIIGDIMDRGPQPITLVTVMPVTPMAAMVSRSVPKRSSLHKMLTLVYFRPPDVPPDSSGKVRRSATATGPLDSKPIWGAVDMKSA